jgi:glycosyltransferase involved in cell wall biosynthesis
LKKIILKSDNANWVIEEIAHEIKKTFSREKKFKFINFNFFNFFFTENIFLLNKYDLIKIPKFFSKKIYLYLFHLDESISNKKILLRLSSDKMIKKIFVSNNKLRIFLLKHNINPQIIDIIPIPIDLSKFDYKNIKKKFFIKKKFGLPNDRWLIGSFQKDGVGWGDGLKPKFIKGPDILINSLIEINKFHKIFVVLSGPSRGYVINELKKNNIPYKHFYFKNYADLLELYFTLDLYIISSRLEGGPRAVLESMASDTPLISTKVGQAEDIVNSDNGFLVEVDDYKSIANIANDIFNKKINISKIIKNARNTAKIYSYKYVKKKISNGLLSD